MINIQKQITYWREGSHEDFQVASELVELERTRHGLFFAHLALEKLLKAHICNKTNDLAPKIHNLIRLSQLTQLSYSSEQQNFLARFDRYQIEGRYPEQLPVPLNVFEAKQELKEAKRLLIWLNQKF